MNLFPTEPLKFTVPLVPPSVNHYVKHTNTGHRYVTKEAITYKDAVAIFAKDAGRRQNVELPYPRKYNFEVTIWVYLGAKQKGDVDNFPKVCLDGMKGVVFPSDAAVTDMVVRVRRDKSNPRSEFIVSIIEL